MDSVKGILPAVTAPKCPTETSIGEHCTKTISGIPLDDGTMQLISNGNTYSQLPKSFIRPLSERPRLHDVAFSEIIPLVDLKDLLSGTYNKEHHAVVIEQIRQACAHEGFFQVVNHGVSASIMQRMIEVGKEFFEMPVEDKLLFYSDDPTQLVRLSTSFNIQKENVFNWRDYLRHHCYPLEEYIHAWPSKPASYKEVAGEYCREVRKLILYLLGAISESLGLDPDFLDKALGEHAQQMAINYYPPCPNPELTYGLPGHSDPNLLTLLLQDQVSGLQVLKNGRWLAVEPIPNAFVVNVGDQLQVLSNGKYRSVLHRAVVNSSKARISIPTFYCPSPNAVISPAPHLVDDDHPAMYKKFTYEEYYRKFWSKDLEGKSCLEFFTFTGVKV
eukprot:Gb_17232 [translate_table: standard]